MKVEQGVLFGAEADRNSGGSLQNFKKRDNLVGSDAGMIVVLGVVVALKAKSMS